LVGTGRSIALALAVAALAAAPGKALGHGANANLRHSPPPSGEFSVAASNGYTITVKSERELVTVNVSRERLATATIAADGRLVPRNKGNYTESIYASRGTPRDPSRIEADLGPFGRIAVDFQPTGAKRVTTVDLSDKSERCVGATRITRHLGTFTGTISFTAENGYTTVEQTSAPGTVGTSPFRNCHTRSDHRPPARAAAGEVPRVAAFNVFGSDAPGFFAYGDRRSATFNAIWGEMIDGVVSVLRIAHASAGGSSFTYDESGASAALKPPAPFAGSGRFRDDPGEPPSWNGDLSVEFPGLEMPLTGAAFGSPKLALLRDPAASGPR